MSTRCPIGFTEDQKYAWQYLRMISHGRKDFTLTKAVFLDQWNKGRLTREKIRANINMIIDNQLAAE